MFSMALMIYRFTTCLDIFRQIDSYKYIIDCGHVVTNNEIVS